MFALFPTSSYLNFCLRDKATETMECIYDSSYPDIWDTPSEREAHLFETAEDCCEAWNCHTETVTPSDEGRWLSNEGGTDCVFMNLPEGMLDADWLFETRDGCCAVNTCPENVTTTTTEATTTQESPPLWYPHFNSYDEATETMECIYDSSYPDVWDTPTEKEAHLFETEEDCCDTWNCHSETVTPSDEGRWLSNEGGTDCVFMNLPEGMLDADWLFETRDGCCAVNTCPEIVTTTTTVATTTQDPTTTTTTVSVYVVTPPI